MTKPEVSVLRELTERELSISEVAAALNKSKPLASLVVKSLREKGFVEASREGARKVVALAPTSHAQRLADLIRNEPYVPWEDVLSYSNTKILLDKFLSVKFGKEVSNTTKWRAMRNLAVHGMLATPDQIALNTKLKEFVEAYAEYASRMLTYKRLPKGAVVLWRRGDRFLLKLKKPEQPIADVSKTAISVFPKHGISFITDEEYYFYGSRGKDVSLEEALVHTLLIDPTSPTYISYALLLLAKEGTRIRGESIRRVAEEYGLSPLVERMSHYFESRGADSAFPFPKWEEFRQLASLYGVEVS